MKPADWLREKNDFAIIYDADGDGICSCAIMTLLIEKLGKNVVKTVASPRPSFEKNPAMELISKYENIIVLDISLDKTNYQILKDKNVLNIDHHETGLKKTKGNVIIMKKTSPYTPTALITYKLGLEMFKDFEKHDWISVIGVISDYGGPQHEKFVRKVHEKYGLFTGEIPFFESQLGSVANTINGVRMAGETNKLNIAVRALIECSGPDDFLKNETPKVKYLKRTYDKVNSYLNSEIERFRKKSTTKGNRTLFLLKNPKYNIRSTLVTILSTDYDKTLAVAEVRNTDYVHVSLRSRNENVLEIINDLKKIVECQGGGHKPAAGLTFKKNDFPAFKKVFLKT